MKTNTHFLSHDGIDIFQCYTPVGEDCNFLKRFLFALSQRSASLNVVSQHRFDVRDLCRDLSPEAPYEEIKDILILAIDEGVLTKDGIVKKNKRFYVEVSYFGVENFLVEARTPAEAERRAKEMFEAGKEPTEMGGEEQTFEKVLSCEEWIG